jgi:hypothetical protein
LVQPLVPPAAPARTRAQKRKRAEVVVISDDEGA